MLQVQQHIADADTDVMNASMQIQVKAMLAVPNADSTQDIVRGHSIFTGRQDNNMCDVRIQGPDGQQWYGQVSLNSCTAESLGCANLEGICKPALCPCASITMCRYR